MMILVLYNYDLAIAHDTMNDEPCKQLNADDSDPDEIDDDSSSDSHHSDTQGRLKLIKDFPCLFMYYAYYN